MNFVESLSFYFTMVCDATQYIIIFIFSLSLLALSLPKTFDKKSILFLVLRFLIFYASFLLIGALFFSLDHMIPHSFGILFNLSYLFLPLIYIFIFLKDDFWHRYVKFSFLAASFFVALEVSRNMGLILGEVTGDNFGWVVFGRTCPFLFCLPVSYLMWRYDISKYKNLSKPLLAIVSIIAYSLIAVAIFENQSSPGREDSISVLASFSCLYLVLLIILCLTYYCFYYFTKSRHEALLADIRLSLGEAQMDQLQSDIFNREELSKMRHDLKNQLSYIRTLLKEGKIEEATSFIEELTHQHDDVLNSFSCSNSVIAGIINMETAKAKRRGIKLVAHAVVPPHLPIEQTDLCSLISNLLDNAFEAAKDIPNGYIDLKTSNRPSTPFTVITMINSCRSDPFSADGTLRTHKRDGHWHGFGLKSIRKTITKYHGELQMYYDDKTKTFHTIIILRNMDGFY